MFFNTIRSTVRVFETIEADIDAAVHTREPAVRIVFGVSDARLRDDLRMTRAEALRAIRHFLTRAKEHVAEIQFSLEDASCADRVFVRQVVRMAVDAGATQVNGVGTTGCVLSDESGWLAMP